ncbi:hypothetical protein [Kibdelosporangium philippinense]|uniref:hypothetical protein n=1 Tax=Kibdelosporangium philippinense TaxID=211113 RepID=UPI003622BBC5
MRHALSSVIDIVRVVCSELDSCAGTLLLGLVDVVVTALQIVPVELRATIRCDTAMPGT